MKRFLSIFMFVVMAVTMSPKVSFAEGGTTENKCNEEQQAEETRSEKGNANTDSEGAFKYLQDKFPLLTDFAKEKAPKVWELLKPYVDKGTDWGKDYYDNVSGFASKMGALGLITTVGLSALIVKIIWKTLKFVVALFSDEDDKQVDSSKPNSVYLRGGGYGVPYA